MDSVPILTVLRPGLMSTIQDLGRPGLRGVGVAPGGAMDPYSLRVANALAGNRPGAAVLEMTLLGPSLRAQTEVVAAIAGADLGQCIDDEPIKPGSAFVIRAGQILTFGRPVAGVRSYLAIAGGVDVPAVLGSRSTFIRGPFGGIQGRALRQGNVLMGRESLPSDYRLLGWSDLRQTEQAIDDPIRVLPGPHTHLFDTNALAQMAASEYTVGHESDRMGIRLDGPNLGLSSLPDMVSEPVPLGAMQVPPNGRPIVLMADQQTTGGYPLIAVVIAADIPVIAQRAPGAVVRFVVTTLPEAREAWRTLQQELATIECGVSLRTTNCLRS